MTSSAGVRRGERFDRDQVGVDTAHRRVVVDLPADSGLPDVLPLVGVPGSATVPDPDLSGRCPTGHSRRTQALSRPVRGHATVVAGNGHDVHAHRP